MYIYIYVFVYVLQDAYSTTHVAQYFPCKLIRLINLLKYRLKLQLSFFLLTLNQFKGIFKLFLNYFSIILNQFKITFDLLKNS